MSDVSPLGAIFLAIFLFSLLGFYIAIRRGLLSTPTAGILCTVLTTVSLALYGLTNDSIDDGLAVAGAVGVGMSFTGMMVVIASFFKNNQPDTLRAYDAMRQNQPDEQ